MELFSSIVNAILNSFFVKSTCPSKENIFSANEDFAIKAMKAITTMDL